MIFFVFFLYPLFPAKEITDYNECEKTQRWFLFFPITHVVCKSGYSSRTIPRGMTLMHILQTYQNL